MLRRRIMRMGEQEPDSDGQRFYFYIKGQAKSLKDSEHTRTKISSLFQKTRAMPTF